MTTKSAGQTNCPKGPVRSGLYRLQAKLKVNEPGDVFEQEADRVADQVMRMSDNDAKLQRKCSCSGTCDDCKKKGLQRKSELGTYNGEAPPIVSEVLRSPGEPLDPATRSFMESRFGHDFSKVRIHADTRAAESASGVHARAYTVGNNVAFGADEYATGSIQGRWLLAHELSHVVQQRSSGPSLQMKKHTFTPGRPAHDHKPGHWADVQKAAKDNCSPLSEEGRIECVCAALSPERVVETALVVEMSGKPLAKKHLNHYRTGGGADFDENDNLKDLINKDPTVRQKLADEIAKSNTGHVFIRQSDYTDQDFRFAFGGIDRMEWEVDKAAGTVDVWFKDRYDFHPVGFGYKKFADGADVKRITNCVHAAAVEIKSGGADDFWMQGEATFPLSTFSTGSGGGGSDDDDL